MYTISKEFRFAAAHYIEGLPEAHPCSRLHGHEYVVIVELKDDKLKNGMVRDYGDLSVIKNYLNKNFDHSYLNEVLSQKNTDPKNPTAENLAFYFYQTFVKTIPQISAITVKESPKTAARYEEI